MHVDAPDVKARRPVFRRIPRIALRRRFINMLRHSRKRPRNVGLIKSETRRPKRGH